MNKLHQKAGGNASEETVLMKAFKFFDLNNSGAVEPDEFAKAIEKIGIMIPTQQVSAQLSSCSLGIAFGRSEMSWQGSSEREYLVWLNKA